MNIILWGVAVTILRFFQTLGIWWFMMSLFRRKFSEYKFELFGFSFFISLLLLVNNIFIHISDNYLIFLLEWPFYILFHILIMKKGTGLAIIEATMGYFLYRITQVEIALVFNWAHIISIQDAITKVQPAILIEFILPFIIVFIFQMMLAKKNIGYYFVNNRIMPNKWCWMIWSFNSIIILIVFGRIVHELELFKNGYYGLDEQPYLWGFISLNLLLLWKINESGWKKQYGKTSLARLNRKKLAPLELKKVGEHP